MSEEDILHPLNPANLRDFLKANLSISIEEQQRSYAEGRRIVVKLRLDGAVISEDSFDLKD
jgi:hypothetical protein